MKTIAGVVLALFIPLSASAITIDDFNGQQSSLALPPIPSQNFSVLATNSCVGGTRSLEVGLTSSSGNPAEGIRASIFAGRLSHSQDSSVAGYSLLSWDGDLSNTLNPLGLAALDLTQDGATALRIEVISYDYPSNQSLPLEITLHDASDPQRISRGTTILNSPIFTPAGQAPLAIEIPFASLLAVGGNGSANLAQIGAIQLAIDGRNTLNADLEVEWLGTNGICRALPDVTGKVIDACGVCGGDNNSCSDCLGVPNGNAQVDRCNVCNGAGDSCLACEEEDIRAKQGALDGGAKNQEKQIKYLAKLLLKTKPTKANKTFALKNLQVAHELQIRNWILSWTLPSNTLVCGNTQFCSSVSNQWIIDEYRKHNDELLAIAQTFLGRIIKANTQVGKTAKNFMKKVIAQHQANYQVSLEVPILQSTCS
jgi:hypothetical protein